MCKGEQQVGEEEVAGGVESWMNGQDPGIKLFGRMISAPNGSENDEGAGDLTGSDNEEESVNPLADSDHSSEEAVGHLDEDRASTWGVDELGSSSGSNSGCEDEKPSGLDLSSGSPAKPVAGLRPLQVLSEIEEEQLPSTKSSEEITARKPEKAAPCPRCESLDTKFCYFNNYNVNQPRHFCKHCQRYWTAGGTLRNVPVGAGRRKSKHSSVAQQQIQQQQQQQQQQLIPFDCFAVRRSEGDAAQQLLPQPFRPVLPVERALHSSCSPAPSTITTPKQQNPYPSGNRSSAFTPKAAGMTSHTAAGSEKASVAAGAALQADATSAAIPKLQCFSAISSEVSCDAQIKSTAAHSKCSEAASSAFSAMDHRKQEQPQPPPQPQEATDACGMQQTGAADAAPGGWVSAAAAAPFGFFNGPWPPYVFNPGWSGVSQPHVATPFFHSAAAAAAAALPPQMFAFPWCHPSMWAAVPGSWSAPPVTWATPWEAAVATMAAAAAASSAMTAGSSLGKHPRERQVLPEGRIEGPLWLPKTLRIDDQGEQVRSSILASLGLTADAQPHKSVAHPKAEAYPVSQAAPLH